MSVVSMHEMFANLFLSAFLLFRGVQTEKDVCGAVCKISTTMIQFDEAKFEEVCEDTPYWKNGFTKRLLTCFDYENTKGWCSHGELLDTAVGGELFNYPELNCVACGKCNSSNITSTPHSKLLLRNPIQDDNGLRTALQQACEVELATIPLYLTALYSLKVGSASDAADAIRTVALEEMLHLNIAANILAAIGGEPEFVVPTYPGRLPLDVIPGKASLQQINKFMQIEMPVQISDPTGEYWTIGEFYADIRDYLLTRNDTLFSNFQQRPVFRTNATQINSTASAGKGINLIISQGEGSEISPIDVDGELSHYYKFSQLYYGKKIVDRGDGVYAHEGDDVEFNETTDVYNTVPNITADMYNNSYSRNLRTAAVNKIFNFHFTDLLRCMEVAFHDISSEMQECVGIMFVVAAIGKELMATNVYDDAGVVIGTAQPTWESSPAL